LRSDGPKPGRPAETRSEVQQSTKRAGSAFWRRSSSALRLTGWRRYAGVLVPLALAGSAIFASPTASAVPSPTVKDVKAKVQKLRTAADKAEEEYVQTAEKLKSTKVKLKAAKKDAAQQKGRVTILKKQVGLLAAESYRRGELSTLDLVLSDDPQSALAQAGYLPSLSARQAGALNSLATAQKQFAETEKTMQEQISAISKSKTKMKKAKEAADDKLSEATAQLNTLQASQRAAASADPTGSAGGLGSQDVGGNCTSGAAAAPSAAARTAINFACSHLGNAYVWAAAGPTTWDCSGLMMGAYAAAGISLPHSSSMQAGYGTRVSLSDLQPGDLVFFHSPISHVGMYLGNGMMVHAPQTGDVVKVASVWITPSAAVRLG
jgi:cell wall-associated NlpC family hydrolase